MGDIIINAAKFRIGELIHRVQTNDPTNSAIVVVILGATGLEADATLLDYDNLGALLAGASDEVDNTGYERKVLVDTDFSAVAPDDANNRMDLSIPQLTYTTPDADGTKGDWAKVLICYDPDTTGGADTAITVLSAHDIDVVPDGVNNVVINAGVFARGS